MNLEPWLPEIVCVAVALSLFVLGQALTSTYRARIHQPGGDARSRGPAWGALTRVLAYVIPYGLFGSAGRLDRVLSRAGDYTTYARLDFLAGRNALVLASAALSAAAFYVYRDDPVMLTRIVFAGIFLVGWSFVLPRLYLEWYGNNRVQRILRGLPDALDMIAMCVSGGLSFHEALGRIHARICEVHPDLERELGIIRHQVGVGSAEFALRDFARRLDEAEVFAMAAVVSDAQRIGTDVGPVIREYAESIRRGYRQRAEAHSNRLSIHMLFPILFCLAPAAYLMLITPSVIELRRFIQRENEAGGALDTESSKETLSRPRTNRTQTP